MYFQKFYREYCLQRISPRFSFFSLFFSSFLFLEKTVILKLHFLDSCAFPRYNPTNLALYKWRITFLNCHIPTNIQISSIITDGNNFINMTFYILFACSSHCEEKIGNTQQGLKGAAAVCVRKSWTKKTVSDILAIHGGDWMKDLLKTVRQYSGILQGMHQSCAFFSCECKIFLKWK